MGRAENDAAEPVAMVTSSFAKIRIMRINGDGACGITSSCQGDTGRGARKWEEFDGGRN